MHKLHSENYYVARGTLSTSRASFTSEITFLLRTLTWITVTMCRKFTTIALHVIPASRARPCMTSNDFRISGTQAFGIGHAFEWIVRASARRGVAQRGVTRPLRAFVTAALILGKSILRQAENDRAARGDALCARVYQRLCVITRTGVAAESQALRSACARVRKTMPRASHRLRMIFARSDSSLRNTVLASKRRLLDALC